MKNSVIILSSFLYPFFPRINIFLVFSFAYFFVCLYLTFFMLYHFLYIHQYYFPNGQVNKIIYEVMILPQVSLQMLLPLMFPSGQLLPRYNCMALIVSFLFRVLVLDSHFLRILILQLLPHFAGVHALGFLGSCSY